MPFYHWGGSIVAIKTIAIIPARKGSKRVPGKNTKVLGSKKLIEYTIEHAINSTLIDKVFINTDDTSIKDIACQYECEFYERNSKLAEDKTTTKDVILDFINKQFIRDSMPQNIVLLQPTVPFRRAELIDETIQKLQQGDYDSVTTHIEVDFYHPNRLKVIKGDYLHPYKDKEDESCNRDDLEKVYCRDGSVYAFKTSSFVRQKSLLGEKQGFVINDASTHVNIDTMRDWYIAQALLKEISA